MRCWAVCDSEGTFFFIFFDFLTDLELRLAFGKELSDPGFPQVWSLTHTAFLSNFYGGKNKNKSQLVFTMVGHELDGV